MFDGLRRWEGNHPILSIPAAVLGVAVFAVLTFPAWYLLSGVGYIVGYEFGWW